MTITTLSEDCLSIPLHKELLVWKAYVKHNGNKTEMCRTLGISLNQLRALMKRYPQSKRGRPRKSN